MEQTNNDKVLDKIKKCLALSRSSEPHEAAAALRQAQKLMELHGVSDIQIKFTDIGQEEVKSKFSVSRVKDYELKLVNGIAKAFGCKVLWTKSNSRAADCYGSYQLIGLNSQVKLAAYTCDVLQRKLTKAKSRFIQDLPQSLLRVSKVREADGFCQGWVEAVHTTVVEFAHSDETKQLIEDYVGNKYPTLGTGKSQVRYGSVNGYNNGLRAGSGESIQRPINEQRRAHITHLS